MRRLNGAKKAALGGMLTAFSVILLIVAGWIPKSTFILPAAAGLAVFVAATEFKNSFGILVYMAVSLLSLILCANKTSVLCFVLIFGYYPMLRIQIDRIKIRVLAVLLKVCVFAAAFVGIVVFSVWLFGISLNSYFIAGINTPVVFGSAFVVFMFVYDYLLSRLYVLYGFKIRPYIKNIFKL